MNEAHAIQAYDSMDEADKKKVHDLADQGVDRVEAVKTIYRHSLGRQKLAAEKEAQGDITARDAQTFGMKAGEALGFGAIPGAGLDPLTIGAVIAHPAGALAGSGVHALRNVIGAPETAARMEAESPIAAESGALTGTLANAAMGGIGAVKGIAAAPGAVEDALLRMMGRQGQAARLPNAMTKGQRSAFEMPKGAMDDAVSAPGFFDRLGGVVDEAGGIGNMVKRGAVSKIPLVGDDLAAGLFPKPARAAPPEVAPPSPFGEIPFTPAQSSSTAGPRVMSSPEDFAASFADDVDVGASLADDVEEVIPLTQPRRPSPIDEVGSEPLPMNPLDEAMWRNRPTPKPVTPQTLDDLLRETGGDLGPATPEMTSATRGTRPLTSEAMPPPARFNLEQETERVRRILQTQGRAAAQAELDKLAQAHGTADWAVGGIVKALGRGTALNVPTGPGVPLKREAAFPHAQGSAPPASMEGAHTARQEATGAPWPPFPKPNIQRSSGGGEFPVDEGIEAELMRMRSSAPPTVTGSEIPTPSSSNLGPQALWGRLERAPDRASAVREVGTMSDREALDVVAWNDREAAMAIRDGEITPHDARTMLLDMWADR